MTTVNENESEMTSHQLSENIWLNVVKDEFNDEFPNQAIYASNLSAGPVANEDGTNFADR